MRTTVFRILLLVCALFAVVPATAGAATAPKVTSVAPLKLKIGDRLTVRGKGFLPGKNRNTVVFKANGARAVFAKAQSATKTKLVVKVPAKLAPFLKVSAGRPTATRFQLRVPARRLSPSYTKTAASPARRPAAPAFPPPLPRPPAEPKLYEDGRLAGHRARRRRVREPGEDAGRGRRARRRRRGPAGHAREPHAAARPAGAGAAARDAQAAEPVRAVPGERAGAPRRRR